jgi:hypothetical protein
MFVCKNHLNNYCNNRLEKPESFCQKCLESKIGKGIYGCANKNCYNRVLTRGHLCAGCYRNVSGFGGSVSRKKCDVSGCTKPIAPYSVDRCASHD